MVLPKSRLLAALLLFAAILIAGQTPSSQSPALILVGDTQRTLFIERFIFREQNDAAREAVMQEIAAENPKLVTILGDLVSGGGDEKAWSYFDRLTETFRQNKIPMALLLGNHDYYGNHKVMLKEASAQFPAFAKKTWAVVRSDGIAVILLNSNFGKLTKDEIKEQDSWYLDQLTALGKDSTVQFIIVSTHHPPYTNSTVVSPSSDVEQHFVPAFLSASKAVLFASGHCHSYEHFQHEGKDFIVTGGGGGPKHKVKTTKKRRFDDLYSGPTLRPFHFCRVTREEGRLRIAMVCLDETLHSFKVCDQFLTRK
jgi:3',5'-cyclic AMP phosphodiesterase CpdA